METIVHYLKLALEPRALSSECYAELEDAINEWNQMKRDLDELRMKTTDYDRVGEMPK
jgi:hypothetical protein